MHEFSSDGEAWLWNAASAGDVNGDGYDDVLIGSENFSVGSDNDNTGIAYLFWGSEAGLGDEPDWSYGPELFGAGVGASLDGAGDLNGDGYDDVVIGASRFTADDGPDQAGAVLVFFGSESGLATTPDQVLTTDQAMAKFGSPVCIAGDINGDGFDDVAVGAPFYDGDGGFTGAIFVHYGAADGISEDFDTVLPVGEGLFGIQVSGAGDVDGDGFDDILTGDLEYNIVGDGTGPEGAAFVFPGSATGVVTTPLWTLYSDQGREAKFAYPISAAGDVNLDGFDDVLVGSMYYVRSGFPDGAAFLFHGSPTGPSTSANWTGYAVGFMASEGGLSSRYGAALDRLGDLDGDGTDDVLVGGSGYTSSAEQNAYGAVFAYTGSDAGLAGEPTWTALPPSDNWLLFGEPVIGAGDVNGDGKPDVLVGTAIYLGSDGDSPSAAFALYLAGTEGGIADDDAADDDGGAGVGDDDDEDETYSGPVAAPEDEGGPCGC